ncbi:PAS/PAC sensor hybrid histidine kinase [Olavius algarvensis associated proteobacterium Delta 3]|nr:PAS/PAC sensor hybrid histidine kinase [Olavius algarvensis associated proteobacterium Delta 3]
MSEFKKKKIKGSIMLVDDTPADLHTLSDFLTGRGFVICTASSGREALRNAANDPPDIILLDVNMPEIDGYEVCERLKADEGLKHIPILFTGVLNKNKEKARCFDLGGVDYLLKPFELSEVLARVRSHLTISRMNEKLESANRELDEARRTSKRLQANLKEQVQQRTVELEDANKALCEIKAQFEAVYNHHYQLTGLIDKEGCLLMANRTAMEFAGVEAKDVIGKRFWETPWWTHSQEMQRMLRKAMARAMRGEMVHFESTHVSAAGETRNIDFRIGPVFDDNGEVIYLVPEGYDITDRQRAEAALRKSEEQYKTLINNAIMGVYQVTKNGHFLLANKRMAEMFGYDSPEEFMSSVGHIIELYAHPKERNKILKEIDDDGFVEAKPVEFKKKDGQSIWVNLYTRGTTSLDGEIVYEGLMEDVTDRMRMERQLLQVQKLEGIGTLAGGIAHDFNNLLMGIQGRASLMEVNLEKSHPNSEHIRGIEEYIKSAKNLTKQLLGFSRVGKYEVRPVDINELLLETSTMFGRTKKEIRINPRLNDPPPVVAADRSQIEQVLLNLYVNAGQAMPDGGYLHLETEVVTLDDSETKHYGVLPGRYAKVSVTDTGIGIDESNVQRVFDPFFTTKEKGRGTGLGLASAYGIVKNHSGIITVDSKIGQGTTVEIYLPVTDDPVQEHVTTTKGIASGSETVLLVDDEEMIIEVGKALLQKLGYRVMVAGSGEHAVDIIKNFGVEIDLVILDLIMPGIKGDRAFDLIREIQPRIPVLLSSGYALDGQATHIMNKGCNGFIQKPFNLSELSQKIRRILDADKQTTVD